MSLDAIMDAIAVHAKANVTGLTGAYSATSGGQGSTINQVPRDLANGPAFIVYLGSGTLDPGNSETYDHDIRGALYVGAANPGLAEMTTAPFVERFRVAYRTNLWQNDTAVRVLHTGYDEPIPVTWNGKPYLLTIFHFQALEIHRGGYSLT